MPTYHCKKCGISTTNKYNFQTHLNTLKHQHNETKKKLPTPEEKVYQCEICNKMYASRQGLSRHSKKCVPPPPAAITNEQIIEMLRDNDIVRNVFEKLASENHSSLTPATAVAVSSSSDINSHNNNSHNNNSHNHIETTNHFNLQFFLNEKCKNAMNISEFSNSIKCSLEDCMRVGEVGCAIGIANIIVDNFNKLEQHERPIHCSDAKRQTIYVKDNDVWEKDENHEKLRKVVTETTQKNSRAIKIYQEKYPNYLKHDFKYFEEYNNIVGEGLGGLLRSNQDKIIKNISKHVTINKSIL